MHITTEEGCVGFLVTKMYEIIISGALDLNGGVITAKIVAGIVGDLPRDVSENAIQFVWDRRNAVVRANENPASFPIAKLLAAISLSYLNAHSDVLETLLQLVDEAGNPVFLGLNDLYVQVVALIGTLDVGIADLSNIDLWQSSGQLIPFGLNAVGVNVLASDAATLVKQWQSIKFRLVFGGAITARGAITAAIANDGVGVAQSTTTTAFAQRLLYVSTALVPIYAAAETAPVATLGSGLAAITTSPAGAGLTAGTYTVNITGKTAVTQLVGGAPAVFTIVSTGGTNVAPPTLVSRGSGFILGTAGGGFNITIVSSTAAATGSFTDTTNNTLVATLDAPDSTAATISYAMSFLYNSTNVTANQLATTGQLTVAAAPELIGTTALTPNQYIGSSAEMAFIQLRALWKDVTPEAMVSAPGLISGATSNAAYYSGFVANTYVYEAYINARLLSSFPGANVRTILAFYNTGTLAVTNFSQPHYNTLTQTQYAATSTFFGFFDMLSTLGFKAEDVFPILVSTNGITFTPQIAQDFDYWFNDEPKSSAKYVPSSIGKGYILNQPLIKRLAGFKKGTQLIPTNAFLKGTDKASDIYDVIFNNSKTATSLFKKIDPLKLTTTNLQAAPPSNDVLYAAAVAQFVQNTLGASRAVTALNYAFGPAQYTAANVAGTVTVGTAPANGTIATASILSAGAFTTTVPTLTINTGGAGYSTIGSNSVAFAGVSFQTNNGNLVSGWNTTYSKPNTANRLGVPDLSYEALFEQCNNPQTADMSQVMAAVYALSNTTTATANTVNAAAGPNVLVSWLAAGNDLATVPNKDSTWFSTEYLAQLHQAVADFNNVDVEEIIIAAANVTPALTLTESSKLFVRLVEAPVMKALKGVKIAKLLTLRKGPWSFSKSPVNVLVNIIKEFYDGTTAVPITKSILFYVGALLNYALVNFSDVSEAIDALETAVAGDKANFLEEIIFAARNDVDRSNILLLMGATPTTQLTVLNAILTRVRATRLSSFAYYLKSFQMVDLIGNLTIPAAMANTDFINNGTVLCNAVWVCVFNDLAGVKLLAPYVAPEILLSYVRKLTIYNSQGIASSANASSRLVFDSSHVVSVYQVSNAILSNLLVEMGIIVQL